MSVVHSKFNYSRINEHLKIHSAVFSGLPASINTYQEYVSKLPIITGCEITANLDEAMSKGVVKSCTFATSSGTTGDAKLFVNSLWRDKSKETYASAFKTFVSEHIVSKSDVVANMFASGNFSTLYDGCNRLLEAIGANILPVGVMSGSLSEKKKILLLMKKLGVNVLFGSPLTIMQCLELCEYFSISLSIEKIVFTGEPFIQSKRNAVNKCWPDARIYGWYGHSETGFIGVQTPECAINTYHIFDDWYFVECIENELIISDLVNHIIPIFRYKVGDTGVLCNNKCGCGIDLPLLELYGRADSSFNLAGDLLSSRAIQDIINAHFQDDIEMQVQLKADESGYDVLSVVIDKPEDEVQKDKLGIIDKILCIDYLSVSVSRGVARLEILPRGKFIQSSRQKRPVVMDLRQ